MELTRVFGGFRGNQNCFSWQFRPLDSIFFFQWHWDSSQSLPCNRLTSFDPKICTRASCTLMFNKPSYIERNFFSIWRKCVIHRAKRSTSTHNVLKFALIYESTRNWRLPAANTANENNDELGAIAKRLPQNTGLLFIGSYS